MYHLIFYVLKKPGLALEKYCQTKLSAVMEMIYICAVQCGH